MLAPEQSAFYPAGALLPAACVAFPSYSNPHKQFELHWRADPCTFLLCYRQASNVHYLVVSESLMGTRWLWQMVLQRPSGNVKAWQV